MSARARSKGSGRGGARAGAGRKAGTLPADLADMIPDIKKAIGNPILLGRFYTTVLGLLSAARLRGENVTSLDKLAKEIRANATAAGKVIPHDIIFSAAKLLRDDENELASDESPDEVERGDKPDSAARASGA